MLIKYGKYGKTSILCSQIMYLNCPQINGVKIFNHVRKNTIFSLCSSGRLVPSHWCDALCPLTPSPIICPEERAKREEMRPKELGKETRDSIVSEIWHPNRYLLPTIECDNNILQRNSILTLNK